MSLRTLFVILIIYAPACASENEQQAVDSITESILHKHISILASDEFGGRAPFSEGEKKTLDYLVSEFQRMGLEPGNGDSYLQAVPLHSTTITSSPVLLIKGDSGPQRFFAPAQFVVSNPRITADVNLADIEIVFAGYGISAPEFGWNDYEHLDVKGKLVIVLVNDPGYATRNPRLFNGYAMTWYGRWPYKYDEAFRQGATGVLVVHETGAAGYPWGTLESLIHLPNFITGSGNAVKSLALEGWITTETARAVFSQAGLDFNELKEAAKQRGFTGRSLELTADIAFSTQVSQRASYNAIAGLAGSMRPDEAVIYTAHWDHLGTDPNIGAGDNIYNGAADNASGVAGVLAIAEAFSRLKHPPQRSVYFLFLTAEEQGLMGARYYVQNPIVPLNKTVANINFDFINLIGPTEDLKVIGMGKSDLDSYLSKHAPDLELSPDPRPEAGFYYRSDHFEFARAGVPALFTQGGIRHKELGATRGLEAHDEYVSKHYHRPTDEYRPDWDLRGAERDMKLMFNIGRDLADSDAWPNWKEADEFRAARDAMM